MFSLSGGLSGPLFPQSKPIHQKLSRSPSCRDQEAFASHPQTWRNRTGIAHYQSKDFATRVSSQPGTLGSPPGSLGGEKHKGAALPSQFPNCVRIRGIIPKTAIKSGEAQRLGTRMKRRESNFGTAPRPSQQARNNSKQKIIYGWGKLGLSPRTERRLKTTGL